MDNSWSVPEVWLVMQALLSWCQAHRTNHADSKQMTGGHPVEPDLRLHVVITHPKE